MKQNGKVDHDKKICLSFFAKLKSEAFGLSVKAVEFKN
jgi:hypothetical protein